MHNVFLLKKKKKKKGSHLQLDSQLAQQHRQLLQVFEALLGQLSDGRLLLGERCQLRRQLLQVPLLLDVLVQRLQLESARGEEVLKVCECGQVSCRNGRLMIFYFFLQGAGWRCVRTLTLLVDSEKLQNFASTSRLVNFSLFRGNKNRSLARYLHVLTDLEVDFCSVHAPTMASHSMLEAWLSLSSGTPLWSRMALSRLVWFR